MREIRRLQVFLILYFPPDRPLNHANRCEGIRVYTKTGADWTSKYMGVVEAARELEVVNAIIDGEAVVTNEAGLPDFAALKPSRGIPTPISAPSISCT
ncbi:hypothetical protein X737_25800 [Mesorhizobium sp. L48C026A00]|nr:hypothetical protein X737_25800 [Mesorhizobium sp. L48C026A00]